MRVLVFPGGTESGLEIWRSLRWHREVTLFSAGAPVSNHAPYVFENHSILPMVQESGWLPALAALVRKEKIDFVYPAHDDVVVALARHQHEIPASIVTSPLKSCLICRSKTETYRALSDVVHVPRLYSPEEKITTFPVFVKPDRGQGSQDAHRVDNRVWLDHLIADAPESYVISEYLPGEEFTVDCFTDRHRKLRYVAGRRRIRVRNGIAVDTLIVKDPGFRRTASAINRRLVLRGAWFFQLKRDVRGRMTLLEVAPRIAGSMALDRVLGANLPLLSLYDAGGTDVTIRTSNFPVQMDRALTNRFRHGLRFSHVFVDLDDTLVVRERVNDEIVRLLYQCVNRGVPVTLVTRHVGDVPTMLRRHHLHGLFDEVKEVPRSRSKASVIRPVRGAIFIDDSFTERRDVARRLRIPTFDAGMIELLLDDRA